MRKYLETTMSVASCDQPAGISAPSILKTTEPSGFVMTLVRRSQVTCRAGRRSRCVKRRSNAEAARRALLRLRLVPLRGWPGGATEVRLPFAVALPAAPFVSLPPSPTPTIDCATCASLRMTERNRSAPGRVQSAPAPEIVGTPRSDRACSSAHPCRLFSDPARSVAKGLMPQPVGAASSGTPTYRESCRSFGSILRRRHLNGRGLLTGSAEQPRRISQRFACQIVPKPRARFRGYASARLGTGSAPSLPPSLPPPSATGAPPPPGVLRIVALGGLGEIGHELPGPRAAGGHRPRRLRRHVPRRATSASTSTTRASTTSSRRSERRARRRASRTGTRTTSARCPTCSARSTCPSSARRTRSSSAGCGSRSTASISPSSTSTAVQPGRPFQVGPFGIEPIRVTHSIADATALAIRTAAGHGRPHRATSSSIPRRPTASSPTSCASWSSARRACACSSRTAPTSTRPARRRASATSATRSASSSPGPAAASSRRLRLQRAAPPRHRRDRAAHAGAASASSAAASATTSAPPRPWAASRWPSDLLVAPDAAAVDAARARPRDRQRHAGRARQRAHPARGRHAPRPAPRSRRHRHPLEPHHPRQRPPGLRHDGRLPPRRGRARHARHRPPRARQRPRPPRRAAPHDRAHPPARLRPAPRHAPPPRPARRAGAREQAWARCWWPRTARSSRSRAEAAPAKAGRVPVGKVATSARRRAVRGRAPRARAARPRRRRSRSPWRSTRGGQVVGAPLVASRGVLEPSLAGVARKVVAAVARAVEDADARALRATTTRWPTLVRLAARRVVESHTGRRPS